jgi:hypothetical protein
MWLSKEIERQDDIKDALRDLAKMIKKYKDATLLDKDAGFGEKFFSVDLGRLFRPRWWLFVGLTLGLGILGAYCCRAVRTDVLKDWAMMNITIVVSIFVLGVSLSTLARNASESGRFAAEYLHDSCRIVLVESMSLLALMLSVVAVIFTNSLWLWLRAGLVTASIGAMIWSVLSFAFVIIEVVRVTVPKYSTLTAAIYASRKLGHAVLKEAYFSVWMSKYNEMLDAFCEKRKAIKKPREYWSLPYKKKSGRNEEVKESRIELASNVDFRLGYRDLNLSKLKKVDRILERESSVLYLIPHGLEEGYLGKIIGEEGKCDKATKIIKQKINSICRFREDRFKEEKTDFWENHLGKIRAALKKTIKEYDIEAFKTFLKYSQEPIFLLNKPKRNRKEFKSPDLGWKKGRVLRLHKDCLEETLNIREEAETKGEMLQVICDSIEKHVSEAIKTASVDTLRIITWLVPILYKTINMHLKDSDELWEYRGKIGSFYAFVNAYIENNKTDLSQEDVNNLCIVLHEGITKWLLVAIESKDDELVKSLCEASRKLVFPGGFIAFKSEELILRHLVLCGHMLQLTIQKKFADTESVKKMLFEDHTPISNINFRELVGFYKENQFPGEKVRIYVRDMFYDWSVRKTNPLTSIGAGKAQFISDGHNELGYTFVYLALLALQTCREPEPIPGNFILAHLEDKADKLCESEIASGLEIYSTKRVCQVFKDWLQGCKDVRDKAEERRIADASLVPELMNEYKEGFWEEYGKRNTFLDFCIEHGYFSVDESAKTKLSDRAPKEIFIDKDLGTLALGKQEGEELGCFAEEDLLKKVTDTENDNKKTVGNIADLFSNFAEWFSQRGCTEKDGLLVVRSNKMLEILLGDDELYRPGWREGEGCRFNGFYKDFPIIYIREKDKGAQCTAIDLRDWKGLCVRSELVREKKFGELEIRTWTDEEISAEIQKGKLKEDQRDQAKGNCPIKVTLFWKWDEEKKPVMQTIVLRDNAQV